MSFACSGVNSNSANSSADATNSDVSAADITDANAGLVEGDRLLDENQTEAAIAAYQKAIELNPDLAEAHFKLGIAYSLLELHAEQNGIVNEPASTTKGEQAKSNSQKAFENAVKAFKKWLEKNPKDDAAQFDLGRTYAKLAEDEDAEEAFEKAVKLQPENSEYQTELGAIRIKLAHYREAIGPLKEAIKLDDSNVRAQELLEDAEAGRQRVDYQQPKNTNPSGDKKGSDGNTNANTDQSSNSAPSRPESNTKPKTDDKNGKSRDKKGEPDKPSRPR